MPVEIEGILELFEGTDSDGIGFGNTGTGHYFLTKDDFEKHSDRYSSYRSVHCVKLNGKYYELKSVFPLRIKTEEELRQKRFVELTKSMSVEDMTFLVEYIDENKNRINGSF